LIASAARAKKAEGVVVLDMRKVCNFTDFFVISSAASDRKIRTIADAIEDALSKKGLGLKKKEGYREASWVLIDSGNVIAHVFSDDARQFYALERLWSKAAKLKIPRKKK